MRLQRLVLSGASLLLVATLGTAAVHDRDAGQRLDALETRVAHLETLAGVATPPVDHGHAGAGPVDDDDDDVTIGGNTNSNSQNSSSSNSNTSSSSNVSIQRTDVTVDGQSDQNANTYTGTWSGDGDRTQTIELSADATYTLTVQADGPVTARLVADDGSSLDVALGDDGGDDTRAAIIVADTYTLEVEADGAWAVILTSTGD